MTLYVAQRGAGLNTVPMIKWNKIKSAFKKRLQTATITNLQYKNLSQFFQDAEVKFEEQIKESLKKCYCIKVYAVLAIKFNIQKIDIPLMRSNISTLNRNRLRIQQTFFNGLLIIFRVHYCKISQSGSG